MDSGGYDGGLFEKRQPRRKKVTLGDTAVEYFSAGEKAGGAQDYCSQLNRYRRLFAYDA